MTIFRDHRPPGAPTLDELRVALAAVTYKPNFQMEVEETELGGLLLRAQVYHPDAYTDSISPPLIRLTNRTITTWPYDLEIFMLQVRDAIVEMECHEADEWFRVNGVRVANPHPKDAGANKYTMMRDEIRRTLSMPLTARPIKEP